MELQANGFWVIGGSKTVAKLIFRCVQCRKQRRPPEEQKMPALPKERCETSAPFTFCGMDCFGPFAVKNGRKEMKRYELIITFVLLCLRGQTSWQTNSANLCLMPHQLVMQMASGSRKYVPFAVS